MQSTTSKVSKRTKKTKENPDLYESRIEIRFIPLPPERRAEWELAMGLLNEIILQAISDQRLAISQQLLFERNLSDDEETQ
jgi:hypothetical protein